MLVVVVVVVVGARAHSLLAPHSHEETEMTNESWSLSQPAFQESQLRPVSIYTALGVV